MKRLTVLTVALLAFAVAGAAQAYPHHYRHWHHRHWHHHSSGINIHL